MKNIVPVGFVAVALAVAGCASGRRAPAPNNVVDVPEPPLSSIPEYPEPQKSYDVSAKVCVYPTLWIARPIEDGLRNAGYRVLPPLPPRNEANVDKPDFIVEPLAFKHTEEKRNGDLWLFSRIVLQVRRPLAVKTGETGVGESRQRVFQVFARTNLRTVSKAAEPHYRANVATAVENLLRVDAFRDALVRR